MKKYKIGFVILHYMNVKVTMECIDSIQKNIGTDQYKIIIVDNKSPNNSGELLEDRYSMDKNISIVSNDINDGFARGNNVGYSILRNECEFVCILNNDVELIQKNLYTSISSIYDEKKFAVLGPRIKLLDNTYCKLMPKLGTYKEEHKKYIKKEMRYLWAIFGLNRVREKIVSNKINYSKRNDPRINEEHTNIILQGCCLIYSLDYLEKNAWAFDPRTDFYGEEALLYLHVMEQRLTTVYTPKITIFHKESVSTRTSKSSYKKTVFQLGNTAKSQKILLKELKKKGTSIPTLI